jgi:hypothetical protein
MMRAIANGSQGDLEHLAQAPGGKAARLEHRTPAAEGSA